MYVKFNVYKLPCPLNLIVSVSNCKLSCKNFKSCNKRVYILYNLEVSTTTTKYVCNKNLKTKQNCTTSATTSVRKKIMASWNYSQRVGFAQYLFPSENIIIKSSTTDHLTETETLLSMNSTWKFAFQLHKHTIMSYKHKQMKTSAPLIHYRITHTQSRQTSSLVVI